MARFDGQLRIATHEVGRHRHLATIRKQHRFIARQLLDEAEDVIPAPAIESRRVVTQLIKNLVHLERRKDGFDQHRPSDRSGVQA